jgi:hypothetical protein
MSQLQLSRRTSSHTSSRSSSRVVRRSMPLQNSRHVLTSLSNIDEERDRSTQELAVKDYLALKAANGGKIPRGGIKQLIDHYQSNGYDCVNRHTLNYRLELMAKGQRMQPNGNNSRNKVNNYPRTVIANENCSNTIISPVTDPFSNNSNNSTTNNGVSNVEEHNAAVTTTNPVTDVQNESLSFPSNSSNKTKSTVRLSRKEKRFLVKKIKRALTIAATRLIAAQTDVIKNGKNRVAKGTLGRIVTAVEKEFELSPDSLNRETVKT